MRKKNTTSLITKRPCSFISEEKSNLRLFLLKNGGLNLFIMFLIEGIKHQSQVA
jgi:hypothetical protein